ncbi:MAG: HD domain-containing protein [bacterium]
MFKIIRDPIHGEIKVFPIEQLIIDTPLFQRLRYISQLVGAQYVYPGCTHTRFSHSLGAMNICSMYCQKLMQDGSLSYREYRIFRLASLLHDISHGPFSHQFDETVYRKLGFVHGHDEVREKIILEFLPYFIEKEFEKIKKSSSTNKLYVNLGKESIIDFSNFVESFVNILREVVEVYHDKDSYKFSIVQGTLGADRLDFIWRDSYFSGIKGFSKGDIERIVSNSYIIGDKLVYHVKVVDEIYSALFGRFMLYKNLYFHRTARAADLMIQQLLKLYSELVDFREYLIDPEKFVILTDDYLLNLHFQLEYKYPHSSEVKQIKQIIQNLRSRKLWKTRKEQYIYQEEDTKLHDLYDLTEELSIYAKKTDIFLFDGSNRIISFEEFIKNNPIYDTVSQKVRLLRIYQDF